MLRHWENHIIFVALNCGALYITLYNEVSMLKLHLSRRERLVMSNLSYILTKERRNGSDVTGADIKLARNACHAPSVLTHSDILQRRLTCCSFILLLDLRDVCKLFFFNTSAFSVKMLLYLLCTSIYIIIHYISPT